MAVGRVGHVLHQVPVADIGAAPEEHVDIRSAHGAVDDDAREAGLERL